MKRQWKNRVAKFISKRSREAKLQWLRDRIEPGKTILVVGASIPRSDDLGVDNVVERGLLSMGDVHALTYDEGDPKLGCPYTKGDACALPFPDNSFDYIVSNAVIEHVGGPERARLMLSESSRVARISAYHTTPDRLFPVETHTQLPILHWFPRRWQERIFALAGKRYWRIEYYWIYSYRSLAKLSRSYRVERLSPMTLVARTRDPVS